ncbi:MAG TPA: Ig-like domain-containing protein [Gemmatimonadales bacterium]|nr:Ig-like domain-containing protein [Gemmatimonadales bacterium]
MLVRILPSLLLVAALASCGGSDLVLPSASNPAELKVLKGDGQTARVGTALPDSLVVQVTDATGRPVVGQAVVFLQDGKTGGAVTPDTANSDAEGRAQARWVLGSVAGTQMAHALVPRDGDQPLTVFFTATATAAPAPPPGGGGGGNSGGGNNGGGNSGGGNNGGGNDGGGNDGGGNNGGGNDGGGNGGGSNSQPQPALHLAIVVQPTDTKSGHRISPAIQVAVRDAKGKTVTSASGEVSIGFGHKPDPSAKLKGDNTERLSSGIAKFDNLRVSGEGSGFTLVASLAEVGTAESSPFRIDD